MSASRGRPVILVVAALTSLILPSGLMVIIGSSVASIRLRAYRAACSLSVMSRQITDAPMISPSSARIGEKVSETGNTVASLRTRMVSTCSMDWPVLILAITAPTSAR